MRRYKRGELGGASARASIKACRELRGVASIACRGLLDGGALAGEVGEQQVSEASEA